MKSYAVIGFMAGLFTTSCLVPQVLKSLKTKQTQDISLLTYISLALGLLLWFIYGIILQDIPMIIANGISVILCGIVLGLKLTYG